MGDRQHVEDRMAKTAMDTDMGRGEALWLKSDDPTPGDLLAGDVRCYALFLDCDGTLLDIAPTPNEVVVPANLVETLSRIYKGLGGALAILTGRQLAEIDTLMKPESRADLTAVLTYHILPGTILAEDISKAIEQGKGSAKLPTMGGGEITATKEGDKIVLADAAGGKAIVTEADLKKSNGVIHHIDGVLMPTK